MNHPSALQLARAARTLPSGVIRLRNDSNALWSQVFAWGLLAMAALLLNRSILTDSDPMPASEVVVYATSLCLASIVAVATLGRTQVLVDGTRLEVRNPIRRMRTDLSSVTQIVPGVLGFPILEIGDRRFRLMGLEESLGDRMTGGSEEVRILREVVAESHAESGSPTHGGIISSSISVIDRPMLLIIAGWALYAASFFV